MQRLPIVAVVGRPNVGKSTLVNRIVGGRPAVVEERPGVTRDRREFTAEWAGRTFLLVDTGGWELRPEAPLVEEVREQAEAAVAGADVVLFVADATTGLTDDDARVVKLLRTAEIPVLVVANKVDDPAKETLVDDLWGIGLGAPIPVSAFHGKGIGDLLDEIVDRLPEGPDEVEEDAVPRLAIVGRPNVGKSTLLNRLAGDARVIVSEIPGTTRDPIDTIVEMDGRRYRLVDTAGIRRRPQIKEDSDYYAVLRAREAVADADVAIHLVDATEGITQQDQRIASEIVEAGAGLVLVLNKWDAVDDEARERLERDLPTRFGFVSWAPLIRLSALTGARTRRLAPAVEAVLEARAARIPTGRLNRLIRAWTAAHPPPVRKGRRAKVLYAVQAGTEPPTFVLFVSGGDLGPDYLRFLENRIRDEVDLVGSPVRLLTRARREGSRR